jgi:hypothetical protein
MGLGSPAMQHTHRHHHYRLWSGRSHRHHDSLFASEAPYGSGDGNSLIAEARRYLATNPTGRKRL